MTETKATIQDWRETAFQFMLRIFILIGSFSYLIVAPCLAQQGDWIICVIGIIALAIVVAIYFALSKKSYRFRVILFLITFYLVALYVGVSKTLIGDSRIWLLFIIVISEILLGGKESLAILFIAVLSWYGLGIAFHYNLIHYPLKHLETLIAQENFYPWQNTSVALFSAGFIIIVSIRIIINNLDKSLKESRALSKSLKKEVKRREAARKSLKNSEKRFRGIFENSPHLIMEIDKNFQILAVNQKMAESLGFDADILVGSNLKNLLSKEVFQSRLKKTQIAFANNEIVHFNDKRSGKYFRNIFVPSLDGQTLQVISQDITEQEQDKQKILHYQKHLTDLVKERTNDLFHEIEERKQVEAKAMEAQKLADIGLLATGIAHELNSPLQGILTNSDYLIRKYSNTFGDESILNVKLEEIKKNILRCNKIVRSLQNYTYMKPSEFSPHSIAEIVENTLSLTKHQFKNYDNISITTKIEKEMPPFICDQDRIMQSLINLLLNARDAMPEGGEITIQSAYHAEKRQFVIKVMDTGVGIPEEVREHIFKPFYTTKAVGKGTGLGLYIVHGFVKTRGGKINVKSSPGRGTTITLTYPEDIPDTFPKENER